MRIKGVGMLIAALLPAVAAAQGAAGEGPDQVLRFNNVQNTQLYAQIANTIRTLTGVQQASLDVPQKTLSLWGTGPQIAASEWLFYELDTAALAPGRREYRLTGVQDNVVRLFPLANANTPQRIQELTNLTRTLLDIQRMFPYPALSAIAVRGTEEQVTAAEWLFRQLDKPDGQSAEPASEEFHLTDPASVGPARSIPAVTAGSFNVMRIFYMTHGQTPQDLQAAVNLVRTLMDLQRMFPYTGSNAIAVRGTEAQVAGAAWLFGELDKPALADGPAPGKQLVTSEYTLPAGPDGAVRVYYLTAKAGQDLVAVINAVRGATNCLRTFPYSPQRAIGLRGTDVQAAQAEQIIKGLDDPNSPKTAR